MSTKKQPTVEFRDQIAKFHTGNRENGATEKSVGRYTKKTVTGVMASFGPWSAWGTDRATAHANLAQMLPRVS